MTATAPAPTDERANRTTGEIAMMTRDPITPRDVVTVALGAYDYEVQLDPQPYDTGRGRPNYAKSKVFLWGMEYATPEPPYGQRGVNPADDARWDAYNAMEKATEKVTLLEVLTVVGADPALLATAKHSRKAGCSMCPCSPGWNVDGVIQVEGMSSYRQVYISRKVRAA